MTGEAVQRPVRWPDAPKRIYLQVCSDGEYCDEDYAWHRRDANEGDGMSWCEDKIYATDVEYVRADLAETQRYSPDEPTK